MPAALQVKYNKYTDFAMTIMSRLPEENLPMDLSDTHLFIKGYDLLEGNDSRIGADDITAGLAPVGGDWKSSDLTKVIGACGTGHFAVRCSVGAVR